jgi:hypothetical protein
MFEVQPDFRWVTESIDFSIPGNSFAFFSNRKNGFEFVSGMKLLKYGSLDDFVPHSISTSSYGLVFIKSSKCFYLKSCSAFGLDLTV